MSDVGQDSGYDAGNQADVEKGKKKGKHDRENQLLAINHILSTEGGRAFLWRLLEGCGVYRQSFNGDFAETAFFEGKRCIGLWTIGEIMAADPTAYQRMQAEASTSQPKDSK